MSGYFTRLLLRAAGQADDVLSARTMPALADLTLEPAAIASEAAVVRTNGSSEMPPARRRTVEATVADMTPGSGLAAAAAPEMRASAAPVVPDLTAPPVGAVDDRLAIAAAGQILVDADPSHAIGRAAPPVARPEPVRMRLAPMLERPVRPLPVPSHSLAVPPPSAPDVHIRIGRVEISVPPATRVPAEAPRSAPSLSLDEYLKAKAQR